MPAHSMGLAHGEHRVTVLIGQGFAVQLVGRAGVIFKITGEGSGIGPCDFQRLAGVPCFDLRQLFVVFQYGHAEPGQQAAALQGRQSAPWAIKGLAHGQARGADGGVDIGGGTPGDAE